MSSGDKGHLGPLFDDFEFEPRAEVWDQIAAGTPQPGELTDAFSEFTHPPHARVWRKIVHQLYPARRRRAVAWWSTAAGIALITGIFLWQGLLNPSDQPKDLLTDQYLSPEERLVSDAESWSGNRPLGSPTFSGNIASLCSKDDLATRLTLSSLSVNPPLWELPSEFLDWPGFPYPGFQHIVDPLSHPFDPSIQITPGMLSYQNGASKSENPVQPMESKTPNLLAMEETHLNLMPSLVNLVDLKRDRRSLDAKLGGQVPGGNIMARQGNPFTNQNDFSSIVTNNVAQIESYSADKPRDYESYRTPIILGFALQKYFTDKWSYLPGVVFTRLNSVIETGGENSSVLLTRQRDYLGLQLGIQRDLISRKTSKFYASANLTQEWGIRGSSESMQGTITNLESSSFTPPNQRSFALGMGARFLVGKRLSFYAEGSGVTYGASANLFNRKLIWPRIQAGLTFSL